MKTLLLLRHAKSSWDDPSLDDFDRPLNSRGLRAAPAMGAWIRKQGLVPDRVLCSAACRARETWEGVSGVLGETPEVTVLRSLYLAEPEGILDLVRKVEPGYETLLVVGHNPGFEDLVRALAQRGKPRGVEGIPDRMPTGALAVFRFDVDDWREVGSGAGVLEHFVRPRDLPGGE
jgi:phosphohistidine phosphatase